MDALGGIMALPYVDEHATVVAAEADAVWSSIGDVLDRSFGGPGAACYARLVGCADRAASGPRPLAQGSRLPGFRVVSAVPGRELVLVVGHRFSSYALIFPGVSGGLYRRLVIGTGGHAAGMRRLLSAIRRRSM